MWSRPCPCPGRPRLVVGGLGPFLQASVVGAVLRYGRVCRRALPARGWARHGCWPSVLRQQVPSAWVPHLRWHGPVLTPKLATITGPGPLCRPGFRHTLVLHLSCHAEGGSRPAEKVAPGRPRRDAAASAGPSLPPPLLARSRFFVYGVKDTFSRPRENLLFKPGASRPDATHMLFPQAATGAGAAGARR